MPKRVRDRHGDFVDVIDVAAKDLRRGDIIHMASDSLYVEETPLLAGARVKIAARSAKEAGGIVRRSYLASKVFDVERPAAKTPAQLDAETTEITAASRGWKRRGDGWVSPDKRFVANPAKTGKRWVVIDLDTYNEDDASSLEDAVQASEDMRQAASRTESPSTPHATKTSPAQLQREINEALAKR